MSDNQKEWTPSMPLRAGATDAQITQRADWLVWNWHPADIVAFELKVARESCVEASQPASLASGIGSHHRPLIEAVVHQLEHGEASGGDLDDIRWCALSLRSILNELSEFPSHPSAGQENA